MDARHLRQLGSAPGTPSRLGLVSSPAEQKAMPKSTVADSSLSKFLVVAVVLGLCTGFIYLNQERILSKHKGHFVQVLASITSSGEGQNGTAAPAAGESTAVAGTTWVKSERKGPKSPRTPVPLNGTHETVHGAEVVWQVPPAPIGVWFLAHGCHHGAIDFWPEGAGCKSCIGLPEEVNITRELLSRGYAVLAVSSQDRDAHRCWDASSTVVHNLTSADVEAVSAVCTALLPRLHLDKLPLYAFGASSGGAFVLMLALGQARLTGVAAQISAINSEDFAVYGDAVKQQKSQQMKEEELLAPLPPIMFIHMTEDDFTGAEVKNDMDVLKTQGVPAAEIKIDPFPLTPSLLHEAAPDEITPEQSKAIYDAFKASQLLDDKGLLAKDPRHSEWREALAAAKVPGLDKMRLEPDESPVSEVLNVLYAVHEIVSRTTTDMLDWFESWTTKTTT